jgi:hypothetical protein
MEICSRSRKHIYSAVDLALRGLNLFYDVYKDSVLTSQRK